MYKTHENCFIWYLIRSERWVTWWGEMSRWQIRWDQFTRGRFFCGIEIMECHGIFWKDGLRPSDHFQIYHTLLCDRGIPEIVDGCFWHQAYRNRIGEGRWTYTHIYLTIYILYSVMQCTVAKWPSCEIEFYDNLRTSCCWIFKYATHFISVRGRGFCSVSEIMSWECCQNGGRGILATDRQTNKQTGVNT